MTLKNLISGLSAIDEVENLRAKLLLATAESMRAREALNQAVRYLHWKADELSGDDMKGDGRFTASYQEIVRTVEQGLSSSPSELAQVIGEIIEESRHALKALNRNHDWHQDYDEYDGYCDSDLGEENTVVIIGIRNAITRYDELMKGGA